MKMMCVFGETNIEQTIAQKSLPVNINAFSVSFFWDEKSKSIKGAKP